MNDLELASLIVSRVCHDLISPVSALSNGVEVLADENDPSMREHAIALIAKSAEQAAAKLKLCRLAYGSMGSAGDHVSLGDGRDALNDFLKDTKTKLDWRAPPMIIGKDVVKLAVNLALVALDAIPRGGLLYFDAVQRNGAIDLSIKAEGTAARLTEDLKATLAGEVKLVDLDGRRVQFFMTGMIARSLDGEIMSELGGGVVTFSVSVPQRASVQAA